MYFNNSNNPSIYHYLPFMDKVTGVNSLALGCTGSYKAEMYTRSVCCISSFFPLRRDYQPVPKVFLWAGYILLLFFLQTLMHKHPRTVTPHTQKGNFPSIGDRSSPFL